MIEIEKGIAIPERNLSSGRACKYPWKTMEIGDSFFVSDTKPNSGMASKIYGRKFVSRTVDGGIRVWRTE